MPVIAWNSLYDELEALAVVTWTDLVRGGNRYVWEVDHVDSIPFDTLIQQFALPAGVIVFPSPTPWTGAATARTFQQAVEFYWVAETTMGSESHRTKAEALASALWGANLTNGLLWSDPPPRPVWGQMLPVNQLLLGKKAGILAGGCVVTVLTHEEGPAN